ncbi:tRNA (adenosine(37)-N6)-dimethylallyltransferase MiaA [Allomuricauda sp. d1]|uniref:tRNA (adenosine(37)-N6)-dimethylallyltransferase MiaA n=1 Tax=Allomuricauda sp. d1 TaxID=3136725 RepID=UPI0031DC0511
MSKKVLIAVVGPTGIGKTKLAISLAQHFNTEILSADSRQFYTEMSIGTAVPSKEELQAAPHHFIQHKSIHESYSVGDFERDALLLLENLFKTRDILIMVGGSGLYVDAVVDGLDDFPEVDAEIRIALNTKLKEEGLQALQKELKIADPQYYQKVDSENPHRLIRALEICRGTGRPYSTFLGSEKASRPFKTVYLGITADRDVIYGRINKRVDQMIENGLLEEAKNLYAHKSRNALLTVGYRELFAYFDGKCDLDFAIEEIKKNTRRFAKRQLTWYRKNESILWVQHDAPLEEIIEKLQHRIQTVENA